MIPVSLVTGFLGSGKTTLLRRIAERRADKRYLFLVNEFGQNDVDGRAISRDDVPVASVVGGSIFCTCKVMEFTQVLKQIAERAATDPLDGVVIEASGVADPRVVRRMLQETRLDQHYQLRSTIAVVDPGSFGKLLHTLPTIRAQIQAADAVLINKADCYDTQTLDATASAIRQIGTEVAILPTTFCEAAIDPFDPTTIAELDGQYTRCGDPKFHVVDVPTQTRIDMIAMQQHIDRWASAIYRVKGTVTTADGPADVDYAGGRWRITPTRAGDDQLHLTLIGDGGHRAALDELAARIQSGMLEPAMN